ncbi:hypothetical protein C7293_10970 [filamentous cyanobacterium CCT1]|uniref:hypothetical protein n=1 Tax=Nodosilinea sp. AN01ver1 TaxID=3423362 RepID=UPI000D117A0B|nr:hypothetical protein C7293_10970 [filamentous cyanobacterium CCT1]PSN81290.1 hypothetical protein C8B47_01970 [filamentous cyanobacterium CCP4]
MTIAIQSPDLVLAQTLRAKLPEATVNALLAHPDIAADLLPVLEQPPLGADYVPREIEVLYDDVTVLHWRDGRIQAQCADVDIDYTPTLVEWVIDGDTAYFSVQGLEVINRITIMPLMELEGLDPLKEEPCKP